MDVAKRGMASDCYRPHSYAFMEPRADDQKTIITCKRRDARKQKGDFSIFLN
jgi:hypothetical protein